MSKINISLPDELLATIDAEARELGLSRSGLIQEASVRYIAEAQADREREVRRLRIKAAAKRAQALGRAAGLVGHVDTVELVHQARDEESSRNDS